MTEEILKDRLKVIEDQIQQMMANLNMLLGGKEEVLFWLDRIRKQGESSERKEENG